MAKKIWIGAAILFGLAVVSGGVWVGIKIWQSLTAPTFTMEQEFSEDGNFMARILYSGELRYVHTALEFALTPTKPFLLGRQIGNLEGDLHLYTIPGNENYAVLTGFMFPAEVYRKETTAPIDFNRLKIAKIIFFGGQEGTFYEKSSREPALTTELVDRLQQKTGRLPENSVNLGMIRVFSDDLPGLYMYVYIQESPDSTIYFSFPANQEEGIEAGPLFKDWIKAR